MPIEFIVEDGETALVTDTARAIAGDALQRITISPIDGTPRSKVIIAARNEALRRIMDGVMDALERKSRP